ncbi:MAG: hypothetical protein ACO3C4_01650 [Candidatus Limnocylindrus sp.]
MNREEVRAALGEEACAVLDGLRSTFNAKLVYAEFADGRSVGRKPDWASLDFPKASSARCMTPEDYKAHLAEIERQWKEYERSRARRRA